MEYIALCFLCVAAGAVIGFEWGCKWERKHDAAPIPMVSSDYDKTNWINQKHEPVTVYGKTFYRMN